MPDFTASYRLCSLDPHKWTYRLKGSFPKYSEDPCFFSVADDKGNYLDHRSTTGEPDPQEMEDVDVSLDVDLLAGETVITLALRIPGTLVRPTGFVRFLLEGGTGTIRQFGDVRLIPPGCFTDTPEPPQRLNPLNWSLRDRQSLIWSAKVLVSAYDFDDDTVALLNQFKLPGDTVTHIEIDARPGSGTYVLVNPQRVFVWTVGTTNNLQLAMQSTQFVAGPVQWGFWGRTAPIWIAGSELVLSVMETAGVPADVPIVLCGHSMGGAIACVLAARLLWARPERKVEVLTFGRPRPGDRIMREHLRTMPQRHIANIADTVPNCCPHMDEIGPVALTVPPLFKPRMDAWQTLPGATQLLTTGELIDGEILSSLLLDIGNAVAAIIVGDPIPITINHGMEEYLRRLELGS